MALRLFVFELTDVNGKSMEPTLASSEMIFVEKISRYSGDINRGDIVIVQYPELDDTYVKRIIGIPGDRIAIKDGALYLNGDKMSESYIKEPMNYSMEETTVPKGSYYVMGDNRNMSIDSRTVGALPKDMIIGHAVFVVFPLSEFGRGIASEHATTASEP